MMRGASFKPRALKPASCGTPAVALLVKAQAVTSTRLAIIHDTWEKRMAKTPERGACLQICVQAQGKKPKRQLDKQQRI
jgi:hypothetical protein